ncbi:MAG TPA: site-specific integrase [Solirubrobacterales bacterium]|jgi:integrase|nr:site-specific integrase [Solirubrobacterales bacterium]
MPRRSSGHIERRPWKDGRTTSWRVHVSVDGRPYKVTLGTNHEGWNDERAEVELDKILAQIRRGTWAPPVQGPPASAPTDATEDEAAPETIHVTLSRWWQSKRKEIAPNTLKDYEWRLGLLLRFRPQTPTAEIDEQWVDELRDWLADQPARNRKNGEKLAPSSVNKPLGVLAQALDLAVDHKIAPYNAARGKRRKMKVRKRKGAFLEPDMVAALLESAGAWEEELRARRRSGQCYGRRSLIAALCLCGPRISELVDAGVGDFDLGAGLWRIPDSKTPAGVRMVEISAFACEELRAHVAGKKSDGRACGPRDPMWVTSNGTALNAGNVRRMLREVVRRTNERRAEEGKMLLPAVTPHTLRRTFACLCFWAKRELPWVMDQIGHEDSRMTVEVYASASKRKRVDRKLVWRFMRFADEPKRPPGSGRG